MLKSLDVQKSPLLDPSLYQACLSSERQDPEKKLYKNVLYYIGKPLGEIAEATHHLFQRIKATHELLHASLQTSYASKKVRNLTTIVGVVLAFGVFSAFLTHSLFSAGTHFVPPKASILDPQKIDVPNPSFQHFTASNQSLSYCYRNERMEAIFRENFASCPINFQTTAQPISKASKPPGRPETIISQVSTPKTVSQIPESTNLDEGGKRGEPVSFWIKWVLEEIRIGLVVFFGIFGIVDELMKHRTPQFTLNT